MTNYTPDSGAPPVAEIHFFGRLWYERGVRYWLRRVSWSIVCLLILGVLVGFLSALLSGLIGSFNGAVRIVLIVVVAVILIGSHYVAFRDHRRGRVYSKDGGRATATGLGLGSSAFGGSGIAGGIIGIGLIFGLGWFTVNFVYSLGRYATTAEMQAVQGMRKWFEDNPQISNDQRPKQFRR